MIFIIDQAIIAFIFRKKSNNKAIYVNLIHQHVKLDVLIASKLQIIIKYFIQFLRAVLCAIFILSTSGCTNPNVNSANTSCFRIIPESYRMHIGNLKDKDAILDMDPLGNNFETFYHTPLPTGLKEDTILTFMTNFTIPDSMKDKPLLLFIPTTAYPIEIKVNKYLVFAGGIMTSKTNLGKYFGEREFISPKILNFKGTNLLTIQIVPRRIRIELPKIFFGGYQDISSKTVWYSIVYSSGFRF